ncbi:hypothetical protein BSL82_01240 [Tardibacter chloracetimidivorans]|uniref:DUF4055 domain-containing protein n=1 Tax=Tardibacter chloracetimidivorans TaxID=1921510 RepID=A0A1L3ZR34_9SPHN|nr:DUF4055 domain-containing protein [Tardibacter chloracetimidivorans]API58088.1 hypothetical protein BSL82_01240 [Tardibacter chloracetimidivorans]
MAVNSTHRDYDKYSPKWKRCRDTVAGQDAVHAAGEAYLPKLKDEEQKDYDARRKRSDFFNGSWRTIDGLNGMAFRKPPTVEVPAGIEAYLLDVNMAGVSLDALASTVVEDVLEVGRIGLLVDHPPMPEGVSALTVDAAQRLGLRPAIHIYATESIINWKFQRINNAWMLAMVVLKESEAVAEDEFKEKLEDRYRVLDLVSNAQGQTTYRQRMFKREDEKDIQIGSDIFPLMNGKTLDFIPFVIVGPNGKGDNIDEPPLIDLIDANLALYQINSDYRHGLHFTGLPTPVVAGYHPDPENPQSLYIGSTSAWVFSDPQAKASYLEFTGQGLTELREASREKKQEMALLGARMIADETKQIETLGATQIKRAGENSILARIVTSVSDGLEWALGVFAQWAGHSGKITYQINRDFNPMMLDAQTLTALVGAVQAGQLSKQSMFDLLQRGDVVAADLTFDEEQERIGSDGPAMPARPAPAVAA